MKKAMKIAGVAASVAVAGIAAASAFAWGGSTGERRTYTVAEINKPETLGSTIVFNSIKDTKENVFTQAELDAGMIMPLSDERFFVSARDASTGNNGAKNEWSTDTIEVEEGKTYIIRLYAHNNNPGGRDAVAHDVTTRFSIGNVVDTAQRVDGYITTSSNPDMNEYWDSVTFTSKDGRKFYLDYLEGKALLENNGIGKNGGIALGDDVITSGVKIGFDALDGNVPGCYKYANYVTIEVKPVFEDSSIEKKVRLEGTKEWKDFVEAKVGDKVEYQIHYKNLNGGNVENVIIRDSLPDNMKYVAGTTKLFNTTFKDGASTKDETLTIDGVNVGNYGVRGDAYVRFTAEVIDKNLACGNNRLINWAKATANNFAVQASADVYVSKKCENTPVTPVTPTKDLPNTGASSIVATALGLGAAVTTGGYLVIASRKNLR